MTNYVACLCVSFGIPCYFSKAMFKLLADHESAPTVSQSVPEYAIEHPLDLLDAYPIVLVIESQSLTQRHRK